MKKSLLIASALVLTLFTLSVESMAQHGRRNYRSYGYYSRPRVSIGFNSMYPRYHSAYRYRPFGLSLGFMLPPIGLHIQTLPPGYRTFYYRDYPYYYYDGFYYRQSPGRNDYEIADAPVGAVIDDLPATTRKVVINGSTYYENKGVYYKEDVGTNGRRAYRIMGKDGVLNTDGDAMGEQSQQAVDAPKPGDMGSRVDVLPADSKRVTIKGEELFVTSDGIYYKEIKNGKDVYYEVVGK